MLAGIVADTAHDFGVDWPHFLAQVVSFTLVALLLKRFAYKPILQVLEDRKRSIAKSLAQAEQIKAELAKTEAARLEVLAKAGAQANQLIEEARAAASRILEQESQKAIAAANQIVTKAREANEAELARMKTELRREVVRLVADTTEKVAGKVLTLEDHRRLAEETHRQIAA
jgi:F-type H+-transporting ATPase subunit b